MRGGMEAHGGASTDELPDRKWRETWGGERTWGDATWHGIDVGERREKEKEEGVGNRCGREGEGEGEGREEKEKGVGNRCGREGEGEGQGKEREAVETMGIAQGGRRGGVILGASDRESRAAERGERN
eukprot:scaffold2639_cov361-Pavlova_lutheri.AAC.16